MLSIHSSNSQASYQAPQSAIASKRSAIESTDPSLPMMQTAESQTQEVPVNTAEITGKGNFLDIKG